jgi:hypothetical protein
VVAGIRQLVCRTSPDLITKAGDFTSIAVRELFGFRWSRSDRTGSIQLIGGAIQAQLVPSALGNDRCRRESEASIGGVR